MNLLSLKDFAVRRLRATHPAFKGTRVLARGTFCVVFETPDPTRVLKLTVDRAHSSYLADGICDDEQYRPRVLADHGDVGELESGLELRLFEVERLQKIAPATVTSRLARQLIKLVNKQNRFPEDLSSHEFITAPLANFLGRLNWFADNYKVELDLHMANFMQRTDGTLVFSDPVYDRVMFARESRKLYRH